MITNGTWQNLKTGNRYLVTGTRLDCTNSREELPMSQRIMVDYQDVNDKKYTRTYEEFKDKFSIVISGLYQP